MNPERQGQSQGGGSLSVRAHALAVEMLGGADPIRLIALGRAGQQESLVWGLRLAVPTTPSTGLRRALLAAATPIPDSAKRICARAGRPYNSHSRAVLADLVRNGSLRRTPDGLTSVQSLT